VRVVKLSLQVVGLSLRARSAGASGDRRGTDKNNRVLSRNVTKERVLSCGTLLSGFYSHFTGPSKKGAFPPYFSVF